jgi:hypothetical protein
MNTRFTAADFESGAAGFRDAGDPVLAKLASDRAEQLREQSDHSSAQSPFTIADYGEAAIRFASEGKHTLAAQARAVVQEMILLRNRR